MTNPRKPSCVIVVENLPVPFDRRVWQEAQALRDAGWKVSVICPATERYPAVCLFATHGQNEANAS